MKQRKEERETNVCMCAHMHTCNRRKENWIEERTATATGTGTGTIRRDEMRYDAEELHCIARCIAFISIDTSLECISYHCIALDSWAQPWLTDWLIDWLTVVLYIALHCVVRSLSLVCMCVFVCLRIIGQLPSCQMISGLVWIELNQFIVFVFIYIFVSYRSWLHAMHCIILYCICIEVKCFLVLLWYLFPSFALLYITLLSVSQFQCNV